MDKPTGGQFGFGGFAFRFVKNAVLQDEKIAILQRSLNTKVFLRISIAIKTEKQTTVRSLQCFGNDYKTRNILKYLFRPCSFQFPFLIIVAPTFFASPAINSMV